MITEKIEDYAIIGGLAFVAYMLIRSGTGLSALKTIDKAFSGGYGKDLSATTIGNTERQVLSHGGEPITLGEVVASSNPFNVIPNIIKAQTGGNPSGMISLNLTKTDNAFAKIGMDTAGVEKLQKQLGTAKYSALQLRLIHNTLSGDDTSLLYSAGWDGTCQYW